MAKTNIENGNTLIFPVTNHINTKPETQPEIIDSANVIFFDQKTSIAASTKDQSIQTIPLMGSDGKVIPNCA